MAMFGAPGQRITKRNLTVLGFFFIAAFIPALLGEAAAQRGRFRPLVLIPWGRGPGQAGKLIAPEASSLGPASFAVTPTGEIYLLDQLNDRILRFSATGKFLAQISYESESPEGGDRAYYEELEIGPGGQLVLLDSIVRQEVVVLSPEGQLAARYPLSALGVAATPNRQSVERQIWVLPDGLYLREAESGRYFRPLDATLKPVKYNRLPGLPVKAGKELLFTEFRWNTEEIMLTLMDKTTLSEKTKIVPVKSQAVIYYFGADRDDNIYLIYQPFNKKIKDKSIRAIKFDKEFNEKARFSLLPKDEMHLEPGIRAKVTPKGDVFLMVCTHQGVQLWRWP